SFVLGYYHKKYQFDILKLIPGYGKELDKLDDDKLCATFEDVFLKIFRLVNLAFSENDSRKEEIRNDRKLAKYLSKNIREVVQALKQPINLPILEEMDKDRFALLVAVRAMTTLGDMMDEKMDENEDLKRASITYLERYIAITDYISKKSNQEYNCSFFAEEALFTYKELKLAYEAYCKMHPALPEEIRSQVDCADLFRRYLIDARTKIKKDEFVKAIKLRFELFPKGEGKVKGQGAFARKSVVSENIKRLLAEKANALLEEKCDFYPTTDYLWVLEENQAFGGYRGYVYPNGKVIFEKFYRSTRNGLAPVRDESYIVMNLLDFLEMAPKSKTDLIDFIREQRQVFAEFTGNIHGLPEGAEVVGTVVKNPKYRDIRRKYHVLGWQENARAVTKEDPGEYDVALIEAILSEFSNAAQAEKQYIK
ncbi:MAG: hypothetical protein K2I72_01515, partial [Bacilli bacterium]|nr:hypothetical protein [Bacilli bacterium]